MVSEDIDLKNGDTSLNDENSTKKGFGFSKNTLVFLIILSLVYLLAVGLISGLVFRKINACKEDSGAQSGNSTTTITTTTTTTLSTTTRVTSSTGISTTGSTITTPTTRLTTSTSTNLGTSTTSNTSPTSISSASSSFSTTPTTSTTITTTTASTTTPSITRTTTTAATTTTTTTTTSSTSTTTTSTTTTATTTTTSTTTTTTTSTTTTTPSSTTTTTTESTTSGRTLPTLSTISETTTTTAAFNPQILENIRLPDIYEPKNYKLKINVMFYPTLWTDDITKFNGEVDIHFAVNENVDELVFHANSESLNIEDVITITNLNSNEVTNVDKVQHRPAKNDYHYIRLNKTLPAGDYKLSVAFSYKSSLFGNRGMFAINYLDDEIERTMVTTAFLPNEARKVFPCFDEPQLKATFDITIQHPIHSAAFSNAPNTSVQVFEAEEYIETKFETSFKMSTYLVGWVIVPYDYPSSFEFVQNSTQNSVPIRVFSKSYAVENGLLDHSLDVAKKSIDYLEKQYLGISDAVPKKIDIIAIPDFPYEAMETWGLILMRETSVLYSDKNDPAITKQNVALGVAEQIAHMWFGNLVTCSWWDDLWFNRAAAFYLKYKVISNIFPDWDLENQFIVEETIPVMWDDGYASSHPLEVKVSTESDIVSVYDKITSGKGAAIMRMIESVFGETQFQNGLKNYLIKNKLNVGYISDFYQPFNLPPEMSSTTPEKFIFSWIKQMNYPLVKVYFERNEENTTFGFEQERFSISIYDEEDLNPVYTSPYNYTWQILLKCKAGGLVDPDAQENQHLEGETVEFTYFLSGKTGQYTIPNRLFTWIKCNNDFKSYYTTEYSRLIYEGLFEKLELQPENFTIGDRANLLHVTYQLAFKGLISYSEPVIFSYYLALKEREYVPWKVFTYHMDIIAGLLEHRPSFRQFSGFGDFFGEMVNLDLDIYQQSENPKPHTQYLLEATIAEFLCRLQDGNCLYNMTEQYSKLTPEYFLEPNINENPIPPNIRGIVYKYHLQNTYNYNDWFDIYDLYKLANDAQEQRNAIIALTSTRIVWALSTLLADSLKTPHNVKREDVFIVLDSISSNPSGRHVAWYFYRHYFNDLADIFTIQDYEFAQSIKYITKTFEYIYYLEDVGDFLSAHPNPGAAYFTRRQAMDVIINNYFWIKERESDITDNFVPRQMKLKKINEQSRIA